MLRSISLFVFLLFNFHYYQSQEIKFGDVSKEELMEESYENDPSANAVVLYKKRNTYYNSSPVSVELVTEIHERIKIYNKEGFDHATKEISLFRRGNNREKIRKLKAYTYNLEDGKVVKTELDKDQIFETEVNYNYNETKFTMPNVKENSIIEYSYEVWSPFFWLIDEFIFQYDIPIKKVEAELRTPEGLNFNQTSKGYLSINSSKTSKMDNRIGMSVDVRKYFLNNVPALKGERFVDNIDNYRAGIMFELVSTKFNGIYKGYAQSWEQVASGIGSDEDYKNQLDKTNSFDDDLDAILSDAKTLEEKMKIIFKHVKDNTNWNGYDGVYFYNGIRKTLKEKKGNAADINLLLVAMLRYAHINANPVVISTKDNFIPLFPTSDRLNYVIAYAVINDKEYFLDATTEFSDINIMPVRNYNWQGVYIDNPNSRWKLIDIGYPEAAVNLYSLNVKMSGNGEVEGKFISRFTNHSAYEFREQFKKENLEEYISKLEGEYSGIEISNYQTKNTDGYEGPAEQSFDFYSDDAYDVTDDKIFFKPLFFLSQDNSPFSQETRDYPIDFHYPRKTSIRASIMIPEGYSVESSPQSEIYQLPENLGEFKFLCNASAKMIQVSVNFELNKAYLSQSYYNYLKEFFNQVIIKESEQIVLTKQ